MAFKRSAVRSRLSPPQKITPQTVWFAVFFFALREIQNFLRKNDFSPKWSKLGFVNKKCQQIGF